MTLFKIKCVHSGVVNEVLGRYDKIQTFLLNKTGLDCFPGSLFFNRSCYYFSKEHERLSWFHSYRFCNKWGLNSTLLIIQTDLELNFIIDYLYKIKLAEGSREQLVFKIGFNFTEGSWKWLNNASVATNVTTSNLFNISKLWKESNMHYGQCGSIVLLETNDVMFRSAACRSIATRFICTYALNPCLNNTMCGIYGRCVNFYKLAVCQCTSTFYGGRYCNEYNSKAYQVIVAFCIIGLILLIRLIMFFVNLNTSSTNSEGLLAAVNRRLRKGLRVSQLDSKSVTRIPKLAKFVLIYLIANFASFRLFVFSVVFAYSKQIQGFCSHQERHNSIFKVVLTIVFLILQVFTHSWKDILRVFKLSSKNICNSYLQQILSEDQITFVCAIFFILLLVRVHQQERFSIYIMDKYEIFFKSKFYKQKENPDWEQDKNCCFKCLVSVREGRRCILKFIKWIFKKIFLPISVFSTRNPFQTIAIFVLYTYDILNIFSNLYSPFIVIPILQIIQNKGGIIFDLGLQIVHVVFIGVKFYPLLIISDMKEAWYTNLIAFLYAFIIWFMKVFNKGLCSRTEVYVQLTYQNINRLRNKSNERVNDFYFGNWFQKTAYESEEAKYDETIKSKIPGLFNETFERSVGIAGGAFSLIDNPSSTFTTAARIAGNTSTKAGFMLTPRTPSPRLAIFDELYTEDSHTLKDLVRSLLENMPMYISLSYLLASYLQALIAMLNRKTVKVNETDRRSIKILKADFKNATNGLLTRTESRCNLCNDKYSINDITVRNRNYEYIENLVFIERNRLRNYGMVSLSKQFVFTYTISFMLIYFFTVFLFRVTSLFGDMVHRVVEFIFQLVLSNNFDARYLNDFEVFTQFQIAYVITSLFSFLQLVQSILSFKQRVSQLNQGVKTRKKDRRSYFKMSKSKRTDIVCNSLHFPGYLIAHLFYGYIILLFVIFIVLVIAKLIFYLPFLADELVQFLLPIILMILLKSKLIRFLMFSIFETRCCKSSQSLHSYSAISYFNFFFDCFLGFMSCLNRIWKTSVISVFYVLRLDISLFNNDHNDFLLTHLKLDQGHVAYLSFTYLEHSFNNQIINGFCEVLIETMLQSYTFQENMQYPLCKCIDDSDDDEEKKKTSDEPVISDAEALQKYKAYARLRNIVFLYYTLQQYPTLKAFICHRNMRRRFPRLQSLEPEASTEESSEEASEMPNFSINHELLLRFLRDNRLESGVKFKINNEFICTYSISEEDQLAQRIPPEGGNHSQGAQVCMFSNTSPIDYFLFAIWFTTFKQSDVELLVQSKFQVNEAYTVLNQVAEMVNSRQFNKAKYTWLKQVGMVRRNEPSIDCFQPLSELFISQMQSLQRFTLERTCSMCAQTWTVTDQAFWFNYINSKVTLKYVESEKCLNKDCYGRLHETNLSFIDEPVWLLVEFKIKCYYNHVPLQLIVNDQVYRLVSCLMKVTQTQYASIIYDFNNKLFYLINNKPPTLEKVKSNRCDVLCAIYLCIY